MLFLLALLVGTVVPVPVGVDSKDLTIPKSLDDQVPFEKWLVVSAYKLCMFPIYLNSSVDFL